jgi:hypothetical protein
MTGGVDVAFFYYYLNVLHDKPSITNKLQLSNFSWDIIDMDSIESNYIKSTFL